MASMSSNDQTIYTICPKCRGEGRLRRRPPRKARNRHDPKRARHSSDPEEEKDLHGMQWVWLNQARSRE